MIRFGMQKIERKHKAKSKKVPQIKYSRDLARVAKITNTVLQKKLKINLRVSFLQCDAPFWGVRLRMVTFLAKEWINLRCALPAHCVCCCERWCNTQRSVAAWWVGSENVSFFWLCYYLIPFRNSSMKMSLVPAGFGKCVLKEGYAARENSQKIKWTSQYWRVMEAE